MRELRDREEQVVPIPPATLTLEAHLREWLAQTVAVRVRGNTLANYRYHVDRYLAPDLGRRRSASGLSRGRSQ
jgi:hypothetical protein